MKFEVKGKPATKGSWVPYIHKPDKNDSSSWVARLYPATNKTLQPWVKQVTARAFVSLLMITKDKPVEVNLTFYLDRPKSHFRTNGEVKESAPDFPISQRNDGDKLERAVWDCLKGNGFADDGQIVTWSGKKRWAGSTGPGVAIEVKVIERWRTLFS